MPRKVTSDVSRSAKLVADQEESSSVPRAKVYESCQDIPPHPGVNWTRFVCISDTHSRIFSIPPGDVLIHAGDLSSWGYPKQLFATIDWLKTLGHPTKIIVAGNHDLCLDPSWTESEGGRADPSVITANVCVRLGLMLLGSLRRLMATFCSPQDVADARALVRSQAVQEAGICYLEHETLEFSTSAGKSWKVYGSPASPMYAQGAFQYIRGKDALPIYNRIPGDVEILITHTPPHGILDLTKRRKQNAGCEVLAERLTELESCRLHVFGHIHEAHGVSISRRPGKQDRVSVNAALQAVIVDLQN